MIRFRHVEVGKQVDTGRVGSLIITLELSKDMGARAAIWELPSNT